MNNNVTIPTIKGDYLQPVTGIQLATETSISIKEPFNMNPAEFVAKWDRVRLRERQSSQEHFIDLCRVLGLATPAEADPLGEFFTFDQGFKKESGEDGFADVWFKDHFAWEYKGRHKDLTGAYGQLQLYRGALGNPPLLVVSLSISSSKERNPDRLQIDTPHLTGRLLLTDRHQ